MFSVSNYNDQIVNYTLWNCHYKCIDQGILFSLNIDNMKWIQLDISDNMWKIMYHCKPIVLNVHLLEVQ